MDEKFFVAHDYKGRLKLPPGVPKQHRHVQSKTSVSKVMFAAAVARPVPRKEFDVTALVRNVNRSWDEYPSEILERGFCNKSLALDCIIQMKGGNHFSIPHLTPEQRAARLPPLPQ